MGNEKLWKQIHDYDFRRYPASKNKKSYRAAKRSDKLSTLINGKIEYYSE